MGVEVKIIALIFFALLTSAVIWAYFTHDGDYFE
jgi:hypothetical protein